MATRTKPGTMENENGFKVLAPDRAGALFGFLQAHIELTRSIDRELSLRHGISFATYEVLSQLAHAERDGLRTTQLAELSPLSLSRVSRLVDELAGRGIVERRECETDRRVSYVALTEDGRRFMLKAQETFFDAVEERFLGHLSRQELSVLSEVFGRIANSGADCETFLTS